MADSSSPSSADIAELQAYITDTQIVTAATALYCYEMLVTFDQEVDHIWTRKWTMSTWIFAINRYATLFNMVLSIVPTPNYTVIFIMGKLKFTTMLSIDLCEAFLPFSPALELRTRIAATIADIIVLVITWRKAIGTLKHARYIGIRVPLSEILIRDGTFFFLALLVLNVYEILADNVVPRSRCYRNRQSILNPARLFSEDPSLSWLILDAEEQSLTSRDLPSGSTIRFNSHTLIGNMGEPLSFGEDSKGHDAPQVTSGDPQKQAPGDVESHLCVDRHPGHDSTDITEEQRTTR
ncbi:hypothetical protein BC629DRAFT_1590792 [Irpex lacteus]|nr:hypothetical protein BC629DRAFT_1590792 [Irpex lacteus]